MKTNSVARINGQIKWHEIEVYWQSLKLDMTGDRAAFSGLEANYIKGQIAWHVQTRKNFRARLWKSII